MIQYKILRSIGCNGIIFDPPIIIDKTSDVNIAYRILEKENNIIKGCSRPCRANTFILEENI